MKLCPELRRRRTQDPALQEAVRRTGLRIWPSLRIPHKERVQQVDTSTTNLEVNSPRPGNLAFAEHASHLEKQDGRGHSARREGVTNHEGKRDTQGPHISSKPQIADGLPLPAQKLRSLEVHSGQDVLDAHEAWGDLHHATQIGDARVRSDLPPR